MRLLPVLTLLAMTAAASALTRPAQAQPAQSGDGHATPTHRLGHRAEVPLDRGPFTPQASRAYEGGGVILQGAPGAPAPRPEPTPPGQAPRDMVPMPPPAPR